MKDIRLSDLKSEFHDWCGLLSENEIVSNPCLVRVIERIERMLCAQEEVST